MPYQGEPITSSSKPSFAATEQFDTSPAPAASPLVSTDPTAPTTARSLPRSPKEETICISCEAAESFVEERKYAKVNGSGEAGAAVTVAGDSGYRWDTDLDTEMQFYT